MSALGGVALVCAIIALVLNVVAVAWLSAPRIQRAVILLRRRFAPAEASRASGPTHLNR